MLTRQLLVQGEVTAIFASNDLFAIGALRAAAEQGRSVPTSLSVIGFDASSTLLDALRAHQLDGVAVQNPMKMGYLGVKTMVAHLKHQPVEKRVDTGVTLVTPETVDLPATKELTNPPIDRYLTGQ
jgi:ribose transport system substrate-binding protein